MVGYSSSQTSRNPFFSKVVCGIEDVLQAVGYSLLLSHSNEKPEP
jgi:DNA-binding LacI/PurR family transcriptional regulator